MDTLKAEYERQIYALKQLIEISRSLNSTLDFSILIDSILYICMGQLRVLNVGLFIKDEIDHNHLSLHRNYKGFEVDHRYSYVVQEDSPLLKLLLTSDSAWSLGEVAAELSPDDPGLEVMRQLTPSLIVPLVAQGAVNGILVLGEGMDGEEFPREDKEYISSIGQFAATAIQNASLFEMASTDMMTKLKLRHFFLNSLNEAFEEAIRNETELSVIMIDIDHFKILNDTYGHSCGDFVLIEVANILRSSIRRVDIAARYGGEEFVLLLPEANLETATVVAERIRTRVEEETFIYEEEQVHTTISLGLAQLNSVKDYTSDSLIKRADIALYKSKHQGRNQVTGVE